jgi:hypothetical protein
MKLRNEKQGIIFRYFLNSIERIRCKKQLFINFRRLHFNKGSRALDQDVTTQPLVNLTVLHGAVACIPDCFSIST